MVLVLCIQGYISLPLCALHLCHKVSHVSVFFKPLKLILYRSFFDSHFNYAKKNIYKIQLLIQHKVISMNIISPQCSGRFISLLNMLSLAHTHAFQLLLSIETEIQAYRS